jgi:sulfur transfer protein SufE
MANPAGIASILEDLAFFEGQDRIDALISLSDGYTPADEFAKNLTEDHKVPGCESDAFLWVTGTELEAHLHFFVGNPQGISAMALASVLSSGLNGRPVSEFLAVDDDIVFDLFGRGLSMGKSLGLINTVRLMKHFAAKL